MSNALSSTATPGAASPPAQPAADSPPIVDRRLILLLATTVGLVVGNLYYIQPLLGMIGDGLGLSEGQVGGAATLSLLGQALGMLLVLPLGDVRNRRPLILFSVLASIVSLGAIAVADHLIWLAMACLMLGLSTTGTHMTISLAASLARPHERGRVVGGVVSGLLTGILLSRALSGVFGAYLGWRMVYVLAAALLLGLLVLLWRKLPNSEPQSRMSYPSLLRSLWTLFRTEPVLRESCLHGSMSFGAFSAFWMTLVFQLGSPSLGYGSQMAGLLGLLAVVAALAAGMVGRLADRFGPRRVSCAFLALTLLSFGELWALGGALWGLGLGVVLMDLGVQGMHVCNQTRVYSLRPEARNRLGTLYIVSNFTGGAVGGGLGVWAWTQLGWAGVCLVSAAMLTVALVGSALPRVEAIRSPYDTAKCRA